MCSPGLSDGIFIPGCIFSNSIQADDADDEEVIVVVDNDYLFVGFDINYNSRSGNFVG